MNILLINHYAGSVRHGMEFRPYYLAREWVRDGHSVRITAASFSHVRSRQPSLVDASSPTIEVLDGIEYFWYPKNMEGSITILGDRGSVRVGGVALNEIERWEFDAEHEMDAQVKDASYGITSVYGFGHALYYDNVFRSLRGECAPATDGREGLKSLELLIAMYRSARDGRRVNLPLDY